MEKYFIAMLTEEESESNLYYVKDDFSISKIKNNMAIQTHDKETLEKANQELKSLVRVSMNLRELGVPDLNLDQINALKIAYETIDDILRLYNNN